MPTYLTWRPGEQHEALFAAVRRALDVGFGWLDAGLEFEHGVPAFVGSLFVIRCLRNLNAVRLLCEAGYAVEAQTLLRGMVEDAVTLGYISTDAEKLAQRWLSFENRRLATGAEIAAALRQGSEPEAPVAETDTQRDKPRYERWTRLSLNQMAKRADRVMPGILEYLGYVYPILSDRAHGNTSASSSYARAHPDGTLEARYLPSGEQVAITLVNAMTIAVATLDRAADLGVDLDLAAFEEAERAVYETAGLPIHTAPPTAEE
ncbi:MAG: hypothetical protein Kow0067_11570 [Coriobacteriia bacterium]